LAQPNLNRQFILLDFTDLDSPGFGEFMRSGEFATYLYMRRHIWRSSEHHSRKLERWYADGYLACGLSRQRLAQCSGVRLRQITADIAKLIARKVVEVRGATSEQVFVLGRWKIEEGVHVEYYYLDRLCPPMAENCQSSDQNPNSGRKLPETMAENCQALWQKTATMNRESPNTECGIEVPSPPKKDWERIWKQARDDLQLQLTKATFDTWVRPCQARYVDGCLEIICYNGYAKDWLENRLARVVKRTVEAFAKEPVDIRYVLREGGQSAGAAPQPASPPITWAPIAAELSQSLQAKWRAAAPKRMASRMDELRILQSDHTVRLVCPTADVANYVNSRALSAGLRCDLQNTFGREIHIEVITRQKDEEE
jgi:hypothetical protein